MFEEALRAASAIGDDTLQRQSQGTVVPESFTHGTSAQRQRWFRAGLASGDINDCDTFNTSRLLNAGVAATADRVRAAARRLAPRVGAHTLCGDRCVSGRGRCGGALQAREPPDHRLIQAARCDESPADAGRSGRDAAVALRRRAAITVRPSPCAAQARVGVRNVIFVPGANLGCQTRTDPLIRRRRAFSWHRRPSIPSSMRARMPLRAVPYTCRPITMREESLPGRAAAVSRCLGAVPRTGHRLYRRWAAAG